MGNAQKRAASPPVHDLDDLIPHLQVLKTILCGNACVGKSAILAALDGAVRAPVPPGVPAGAGSANGASDHDGQYIPTIGVEFASVDVAVAGGLQRVRLQVWDTAGQERFACITASYFRGAMALVMVFDVCRRASFDSLEARWIPLNEQHGRCPVVPTIVVGHRQFGGGGSGGEEQGREVDAAEGRALAAKHGFAYAETGAGGDSGTGGGGDPTSPGEWAAEHQASVAQLFRRLVLMGELRRAEAAAAVQESMRAELAELEAAADERIEQAGAARAIPCAEMAGEPAPQAHAIDAAAPAAPPAAAAAAPGGGGGREGGEAASSSSSSDDEDEET